MTAWEDIGRLAARFGPREAEEDRRERELDAALARWAAENQERAARGEVNGQDWRRGDPFVELLLGFGGSDYAAREANALAWEKAAQGADRTNIEDRRFENPAAAMPPYLPEHIRNQSLARGPEGGRPNGWEETYDPKWIGLAGRLLPETPEDVRRGVAESAEWTELREQREGDPEEGLEATASPLVLRKRYPNGTVTYVHALTGQPLFDEGLYGMNDPQGAEPGQEVPDPFWRAGRREW